MKLNKSQSQRVIESLRTGVPCEEFVEAYSSSETDALRKLKSCLNDVANNDFSVVRFLRGDYGSGKSHTLARLRAWAIKQNFVVSTVQISREHTFGMIERTLAKLIESILVPHMENCNDPRGLVAAFGLWAQGADSTEISDKLNALLASEDFGDLGEAARRTILSIATRTGVSAGDPIVDLFCSWLAGGKLNASERRFLGVWKNVDKKNARSILNGLASLLRKMGYAGWLLIIDEQEAVSTLLAQRQRNLANSNLRMIIDSKSEVGGIMWVFASTPEFFDDPRRGIGTYDALRGRISKGLVYEASSLGRDDLMEIGDKLASIYAIAYPEDNIQTHDISSACDYAVAAHHSAMPRLFVEAMVGALDLLRMGEIESFDDAFSQAFQSAYGEWTEMTSDAG